jgi:L-threonylcarbamoyladenylate synthase
VGVPGQTPLTTEVVAADAAGTLRAIAALRAGQPVALPTETVYGLAAPAGDALAVARVYAAKGRPAFNPLIVHVADVAAAEQLVEISPTARALMARFWPGPLTLVLPLRPGAPVAALVTAGLSTLAVRCPAHPVMQAVITATGPLAAPSANASGRLSATRAAHVLASLDGRIGLILDGGPCAAGLESTIVALDGVRVSLLRPGAVAAELLGCERGAGSTLSDSSITAPGQLASHYAPRQPLRLDATDAFAGEFHIGFGSIAGDVNLSATSDLVEAAANLFTVLHAAEVSGCNAIVVAPIPQHGIGLAINDRLRRAAAPR